MANAAINLLPDGTLYDVTTVTGDVRQIATRRVGTGLYEVKGTHGMVPPPSGWGVITNPTDGIRASVSFDEVVLCLEITNQTGQRVDIGSKVTLHVCLSDAPIIAPVAPPAPDPAEQTQREYTRRRAVADAMVEPLQDRLDIDEGTPEIETRLLTWKRYRVALSRIVEQQGYPTQVEWPVPPQ